MSRKHPHRAGNQPVTRRYVAGVVRRARDEIISAVVHVGPSDRPTEQPMVSDNVTRVTWLPSGDQTYVEWRTAGGEFPPKIEADRIQERLMRYAGPIGKES
jgi:hypothetical protein